MLVMCYKWEGRTPEPHKTTVPLTETGDSAPNTEDFLTAQRADRYCQQIAVAIGKPGSSYTYDRESSLVRRSKLYGGIQIEVPVELQPMLLSLVHFSVIEGHLGGRRMYDTFRRDFYWRHMVNGVHTTFRSSESLARMRGAQHKHQCHVKSFPPNGRWGS